MINTIFLQSDVLGYAMPILIFVAFYFLMLRPQMKRQKQEKNFQENLKPGMRIVTTSGIHGKIVSVNDEGIIVETMSGKLKFEKAAISREFTQSRYPETKEEKENK